MCETYRIQMKAFILNGKTPYKNMGEKLDDDFLLKHIVNIFCDVFCCKLESTEILNDYPAFEIL